MKKIESTTDRQMDKTLHRIDACLSLKLAKKVTFSPVRYGPTDRQSKF